MAFVESTAQAAQGGFRGVKKFRALLVDIIEPHDPPESWESKKQLIDVVTEEAVVLEMFEGEDDFEFKDGKYTFSVPYAEKGKTPSANSIYMRTWVGSAEELGEKTKGRKMKPSEFKGSYVVFEKQPRLLFSKPKTEKVDGKDKAILGPDGKKIMEDIFARDQNGRPNHFCFTADEAEGDIREYAKGILVGLNPQAALRKLLTDNKAKQHSELKDKLKDGTLAEYLGLVVVDDLFQLPVVTT